MIADRLFIRPLGWTVLTLLLAVGCSKSSPTTPDASAACGIYPSWQSAAYVLPYAVGSSHTVSQANCTPYTHQDLLTFAYDFAMPIGTLVTAARSGTVVWVEEHWPNGDGEWYHSNLVRVHHGDGTYALYAHLTTDGALVTVGDSVAIGDPIGRSGNSGYTLDLPHLHFQVAPCSFYENCGTLAVTFRNTTPNPEGLVGGRVYEALAY